MEWYKGKLRGTSDGKSRVRFAAICPQTQVRLGAPYRRTADDPHLRIRDHLRHTRRGSKEKPEIVVDCTARQ
jgi:hypothetical protein